jgi:chromosomal replication initiation ATPase DnaA
MIVRSAAHYRLPPVAEAPVQPASRVRDFILIHGTPPTPRITVADVQAATCAHFGLEPGDMTTDCRSKRIARPRQIAMALARQLTKRTLPEIGRMFGNRHHTTVLHAAAAVDRRAREDDEFRSARDAIASAATLIADERCQAVLR